MKANQTRQQAHEQIVLRGQMGSLAGNPSEEYLLSLREYAYKWIANIDEALHLLYKKQAVEAELAAEMAEIAEPCDCGACTACVAPWDVPQE